MVFFVLVFVRPTLCSDNFSRSDFRR